MRLKIWCDGESWKILGFWMEVNKAIEKALLALWSWTVEDENTKIWVNFKSFYAKFVRALFRSKKFLDFETVALSFLFDKYCSIIE